MSRVVEYEATKEQVIEFRADCERVIRKAPRPNDDSAENKADQPEPREPGLRQHGEGVVAHRQDPRGQSRRLHPRGN